MASYSGAIYFSDNLFLHNVLYIPQFHYNLVSVYQLTKSLNCKIVFSHIFCAFQDHHTQQTIGHVELSNNLYVLKETPRIISCHNSLALHKPVTAVINVANTENFDVWHYRLGHPYTNVLQHISSIFPYVKFNKRMIYDFCHLAKQSKLPFPNANLISLHAFNLVYMDIRGPIRIAFIQGYHYFLTIVDDHTRFTWLFLMKNKSETRECITNFITYIHTQFSVKIKAIRSDNGSEFNMSSYFASQGIIHKKSCVETPQQNSVVERKHRHLLNVTRALLFHSKLPKCFWSHAMLYATYIINRLPTPVLQHKSPFELLYDQPPTYLDLKVFGCLTYASTLTQQRNKLYPRARQCIFLGFRPSVKGYVLFDPNTREIFVSRHAIFHESKFPYAMNSEKHDSITQTDFIDQNDSPFLFEFPTPMTIQQPATATPTE